MEEVIQGIEGAIQRAKGEAAQQLPTNLFFPAPTPFSVFPLSLLPPWSPFPSFPTHPYSHTCCLTVPSSWPGLQPEPSWQRPLIGGLFPPPSGFQQREQEGAYSTAYTMQGASGGGGWGGQILAAVSKGRGARSASGALPAGIWSCLALPLQQ